MLLIGPAGAGKTTVARHWADRRAVPTAHISLDDVREWVRSGFADPQAGWNDHSEAQYRLARRTCGFAARNFLANGISCILDDAVFPDRPVVGLGGWKRHVGPGLLPVVLLPGLEIVLERNAARSGNRRLSDEEVARIHGRMAGWYGSGLPIIDNSRHDVAHRRAAARRRRRPQPRQPARLVTAARGHAVRSTLCGTLARSPHGPACPAPRSGSVRSAYVRGASRPAAPGCVSAAARAPRGTAPPARCWSPAPRTSAT